MRLTKAIVTSLLILCSLPAFASHATNGLEGIQVLLYIAIVGVTTFIAFILAVINAHRNGSKLRIITIIFSLPLLIFGFYSFTFSAAWALGSFVILIFLWTIIYSTWQPADA